MAAFNKFNSFVEALAEKVHDLGSDTLKVMLTNTAPAATNAVKVDITELAAGNGYTAGGNTAAVSASSQTSGTYKLVLADPTTWTAVGGTIGPFRYAVLYNDTASNDELIAWWDYGASLTLNAGETFTVDFDASTGVLTIV
jgi:flagellar capping protein FliD